MAANVRSQLSALAIKTNHAMHTTITSLLKSIVVVV